MTSARFSAGIHAVARLLEEDAGRVRRLLVDRRIDNERVLALLEQAAQADIKVERVARNRLDDLAAGTRHQGVVAELRGASSLDEAGLRTLVEQRLTSGRGLLLLNRGDLAFEAVPAARSGFVAPGDVRRLAAVRTAAGPLIVVAGNDDALTTFTLHAPPLASR